jgi:hypothetical protein
MTKRRVPAVIVILVWTLVASSRLGAQSRAAAEFKIVVIEGEGAVNIIQQKTAVTPLIEVRDRNDQPVAGATVNFVVRTGRATFGGARTLTVTTNAAGRAAAAGFAPSGTGAVQIGATATFQGQTAAAVTIAQTNVLTAAEAAAVSSAGASAGGSGGGGTAAGGGAGTGGGGGLSATTLSIVGGAIAGAALVAKETMLSGTVFSGQFSGAMPSTDSSAPGFGPFSCTRIENQTGTLEIEFDSTDGAISGTMSAGGDIRLSPGTCNPDRYNTGTDGFELERGSVTGSRDNLSGTGHQQNDYTSPDPAGSGVNAYDYTFTGRFTSDQQLTGSLTIVRNTTWRQSDGGYAGTSFGTITYQVTLQKQ